jgi:sec-independent protein translocase protein TatB
MFEVGFTEIVLILGLALLVLGPEKLPGLAEKVGRWTGRARAMARQLRTQLEQEVSLDEMTKSRPMQAPPPQTEAATPPNTPDASATTPAESTPATDPTASTEPPAGSDQPHNKGGLDLQTMVSGMEPPPQSAPETPTDKVVRDSAVQ